MIYSKAKQIADSILQELKPHCVRIEIAGSIRRKKTNPNDIEIVAIPKKIEIADGMFDTKKIVHPSFIAIVESWEKVKGEPTGKYTQRILPEGIKLDLFFATVNNWGNIFLIRTGDWEFSKKFMGILLPRKGYKQVGGVLKLNDKVIDCREEIDLFNLAGIKYIEPQKRNGNAI